MAKITGHREASGLVPMLRRPACRPFVGSRVLPVEWTLDGGHCSPYRVHGPRSFAVLVVFQDPGRAHEC